MKIPLPMFGFRIIKDHAIDKKEWGLALTIGYVHAEYAGGRRMMWYTQKGGDL